MLRILSVVYFAISELLIFLINYHVSPETGTVLYIIHFFDDNCKLNLHFFVPYPNK